MSPNPPGTEPPPLPVPPPLSAPPPLPAPPPSGAIARLADVFRRQPVLYPLIAMVLLLGFNLLFTPHFAELHIRNGMLCGSLVDILQNAAPVMLMAVGMTVVVAVAGIDLSVGSVLALAGTVAAMMMVHWGQPLWLAIAAGLAAAALAGMANGMLVSLAGLQPIIATLILLVGGRGIAQAITNDQKVDFAVAPPWAADTLNRFEFLANGSLLGLPVPIYLVAAAAAGMVLLLRKTALGLYVEAVGSNARAARLAGLQVHTVRIFAYVFSGLCAGLAGLVATADIRLADVSNAGLYAELDVILAVVIGGTSLAGGKPRIVGSLIGAIILQTLTAMLQMHNIKTEHTLMVKAVVALAVCFLQSPLAGRIESRMAPMRNDGGDNAHGRPSVGSNEHGGKPHGKPSVGFEGVESSDGEASR